VKSAAKTQLLETYFEKRVLLVRYFTRLTADSAMAEDIVQDLYVRLSGMTYESQIGDPTAFLFRMAHNIHLNQLRALRNSRGRDAAWQELSGHRVGDETADDGPSAEDQAHGRQLMQRLTAALSELPEKTQAIFRLHRFDGLSQTEVATRMEMSLSSIEKHLATALRHLTARLRPPGAGT
jgi:RNA polymerase sigma factor (sigma-70 family)